MMVQTFRNTVWLLARVTVLGTIFAMKNTEQIKSRTYMLNFIIVLIDKNTSPPIGTTRYHRNAVICPFCQKIISMGYISTVIAAR